MFLIFVGVQMLMFACFLGVLCLVGRKRLEALLAAIEPEGNEPMGYAATICFYGICIVVLCASHYAMYIALQYYLQASGWTV